MNSDKAVNNKIVSNDENTVPSQFSGMNSVRKTRKRATDLEKVDERDFDFGLKACISFCPKSTSKSTPEHNAGTKFRAQGSAMFEKNAVNGLVNAAFASAPMSQDQQNNSESDYVSRDNIAWFGAPSVIPHTALSNDGVVPIAFPCSALSEAIWSPTAHVNNAADFDAYR